MPKATYLEGLRIGELSLVDFPANEHSHITIFKRKGHDMRKPKVVNKGAKFLNVAKSIYANEVSGAKTFAELIAQREEQQARWDADEKLRPLFYALQESISSIACDATLDTQARVGMIAQSVWDFMNSVAERVPEVEEELTMALTKANRVLKFNENHDEKGRFGSVMAAARGAADHPDVEDKNQHDAVVSAHAEEHGVSAGSVHSVLANGSDFRGTNARAFSRQLGHIKKSNQGEDTMTPEQIAELQKNLATAVAEIATLKSDLEVAKAATKTAQTDEVIKVGAIEVRKSVVGDTTFAVMKAQQEEIELHKFTTQANADIPNLPGEAADKAKVLRVISTLDAPVAKTLTEMLKGGNAAMVKAVKELGAGGGGNQDDPDEQLDQMALKYGKDNKVSKAVAYDAVLSTPEGQALYNASEVRKRAA